MKKDLLALVAIVLLIVFIALGTNIQSVDEYYLTHIDDIREDSPTVYLSIDCSVLLGNLDLLDENLREEDFVRDGVILPKTQYVLRDGDTVFDLLYRAVRYHKIQMEYTAANKTKYGSVYVKGIAYLYEYSCGPLSGWTYAVNGERVSYGCSQYVLQDGDVVEWIYTLTGK